MLLRRIAAQVSPDIALDIPRPIRVSRNRILRGGELERTIDLAAGRAAANGCILLLFDANGDCPARLAPELLQRARDARPDRTVCAVLAKMEYEAWFIAAAASLIEWRDADPAVAPPGNPEAIANAKGWLAARMRPGKTYRETLHQASFTARFDMDAARAAAPSFDKLWRDVSRLLRVSGAAG